MASNRITEGVGKKIVEALKKQSDIEIVPVPESHFNTHETVEQQQPEVEYVETKEEELQPELTFEEASYSEQPTFTPPPVMPQPQISRPAYTQPAAMNNTNFGANSLDNISNDLDGFEIPTNVAVLKQLISKLPSGVTKQTGAQIIKQTMEALGISMSSVLQEAQQVQEGLNNSARDCQTTIIEYRKQINLLEKQAQKYQRQYAALNDIISLFIQTNH